MTELSPQPTLLGLPAELIAHVLGYLSALDVVSTALTSRKLAIHAYDDQIWQPLVNANLPSPLTSAAPLPSFRRLYAAHHPYWFVPRHCLWFSDADNYGKLLIARYEPSRGTIEAYAVVATRGPHTLEYWEKDREVIIHSFNPRIALDLDRPVLRLDVDGPKTEDQPNHNPSDRAYAPSSSYSKEVLMEISSEAGLYSSFMLCRPLPDEAITEQTRVWPPLRFPAPTRTRNDTRDGYQSAGHRPSVLSEVSTHHFRLRKWVEYTGRRSSPSTIAFTSPNGLSAALGFAGPYFAQSMRSTLADGRSIRMPEDITTYATLPASSYTPTPAKPWQGIWCGDYSGHGCEFLMITQPDRANERPLPSGMAWLRQWFAGGRRGSTSSDGSFASAQEDQESSYTTPLPQSPVEPSPAASSSTPPPVLGEDAYLPTGRLEAIKLTGDPNIPRGEYTFIAPDIGPGGLMREADEAIFRGARVVRSAGHIAGRGFREDQYTPSQLIMISGDKLAQFWEGFGHISYYARVDLDALLRFQRHAPVAAVTAAAASKSAPLPTSASISASASAAAYDSDSD